jgi:hypothetical protein
MKEILRARTPFDIVTPLLDRIRSGQPVEIGHEQVELYNSLQVFQAHRFVVDPEGRFTIAREVMSDRKAAAED